MQRKEAPRAKKRRAEVTSMSNDEVEKVMEDFMNRLFVNPDLLEDHKLNEKIEIIFENKVFQKMVEGANVLEDAGLQNSRSANNDRSEDFDIKKKMLDSKLIEASVLPDPYDAQKDERRKSLIRKEAELAEKIKVRDMKKKSQASEVPVAYNNQNEQERDISPIKPFDEEKEQEKTSKLEEQIKSKE